MHCLGTCKIILRTAKATAVGLRAAVGTKHTWVQWLGDLDSDYLVSECLFLGKVLYVQPDICVRGKRMSASM